jgi:hypothetical protein
MCPIKVKASRKVSSASTRCDTEVFSNLLRNSDVLSGEPVVGLGLSGHTSDRGHACKLHVNPHFRPITPLPTWRIASTWTSRVAGFQSVRRFLFALSALAITQELDLWGDWVVRFLNR